MILEENRFDSDLNTYISIDNQISEMLDLRCPYFSETIEYPKKDFRNISSRESKLTKLSSGLHFPIIKFGL